MKLIRIPFYPFLLGIYPILFLYLENAGKARFHEVYPAIAVFLLAIGIVWILIRILSKSSHTASFGALLFVLFISTYRIFFNYISLRGIGSAPEQCDIFIFLFEANAALILLVLYYFKRNTLEWTTIFFNAASISLLVFVGYRAATSQFTYRINRLVLFENEKFETNEPRAKPNVYYLVFDAYGRHDVLRSLYEYDNSSFLEGLKKLGFVVVDHAGANYCQTLLSLASSLNMTYLDQFARHADRFPNPRAYLQEFVEKNRVFHLFRELGYKIVSFSSGYSSTEFDTVDEIISSPWTISEFQNLALGFTPIPLLFSKLPFHSIAFAQFEAHRRRIRFIFKQLAALADSSTPKFIFAHFLSPHPPFVFGSNGEDANPERIFSLHDGSHFTRGSGEDEYISGYSKQVQHLDTMILQSVSKIIERDPEAIILIQGDHGPGGHLNWNSLELSDEVERLSILSAYRVPIEMKNRISSTLSPVNSFRFILKELFGMKLELLPDRSYFSPWPHPFMFTDVTDQVQNASSAPTPK